MGVELFWHNKTAYKSAVSMLDAAGKAAVIHPTGTGKSFIALKLCEENQDKRVCWLSPSEYIFRTQIENWIAVSGSINSGTKKKENKSGEYQNTADQNKNKKQEKNDVKIVGEKFNIPPELKNIYFYTYAKLMRMSEAEIAKINPDYIILDEFHRCGAAGWGRGVEQLRKKYSEAKVLGLSATNIRYLDNQRDMAWELFEGNIASELTLGEAIATGILSAPKYVLSIYSYQKEFKQYERRIKQAKNKVVRDTAEQQLEALRRALEQAEGLDQIFAKYITPIKKRKECIDDWQKTLKSKETKTKIEKLQREKEKITKETEETKHFIFTEKQEILSENIYGKYLVFCANYDHLNEMKELASEWFANIDPAPHIYTVYSEEKQAAQEFQAFQEDHSCHLKLLYCINMLNEGIHLNNIDGVILLRPTVSPTIYKQQIGRALAAGGKKQPIIFDIVMNIENLYSIGAVEEELREAVLSYRALGREKELVNERFQIVDEIQDCRTLFAQLNETLGASWDAMYAMAKEYYQGHKHLNVPKRYKTLDGYSLGMWLATQRKVYAGKVSGNLSKTQIEKLEKIGMKWQGTRELAWEKHYKEAVEYYNEHGHLLVGIQEIYNKKKEQDNENKESFIEDLTQKDTEKKEFQSCEKTENKDGTKTKFILKTFSTEQNLEKETTEQEIIAQEKKRKAENEKRDANLARWLARLRLEQKRLLQGKTEIQKKEESIEIRERKQNQNINLGISLTPERIAALDQLGMVWDVSEFLWEQYFAAAEEYYKKYGNLDVPAHYRTADGKKLGRWIANQKKDYREKNKFEDFTEQIQKKENQTEKTQQISKKKRKGLSKEQEKRLEAIGITWGVKHNTTWEKSYAAASKYYQEYKNLDVSASYVTMDGFRLGRWIRQQREKYKKIAAELQKQENHKELNRNEFLKVNRKMDTGSNDLSESERSFPADTEDSGKKKRFDSRQKDYLSKTSVIRIKKLEQIGMIWEQENSWERRYQLAKNYYKEYGNLEIPSDYVVEGVWLGRWLREQKLKLEGKTKKSFTREQEQKLYSIGIKAGISQSEITWRKQYKEAEEFYQNHGNLSMPKRYIGKSGKNLGAWMQHQRSNYRNGLLADWQIAMLNQIGMVWEFEDPWKIGFLYAEKFFHETGHLEVPYNYVNKEGYRLGRWISNQRYAYHNKFKKSLNIEQIHQLEKLCMVWNATPGKNRVKKDG